MTTSKQVKTVEIDGVPYYVVVEGPPEGQLVVLIHALMSNLQIYDSTVQALHKSGYRTLRFDHIGHNNTPPPSAEVLATRSQSVPYHFDDIVRHIDHIITTAVPDVEPFALIGCSIGGVLVIRYAIMYPRHAKKIVSCAAPGLTSLDASKPKWQARIAQWQAEGNVENLATATIERWFPDPCPLETKAKALDLVKTCTLPGYEICAKATMNFDYTEMLPTLNNCGEDFMILAGENDANIGPRQILVDASQTIKGSKYVLMKDTGHIPPMHWPDEFEKIVLEFLKR